MLVIGFDLGGAMDARELKRPGAKHPLAVTFLAAIGLVADLQAQVGYACQSASECGRMGEVAYKAGDLKRAMDLYESQRVFAEGDEMDCRDKAISSNAIACEKLIVQAYNNLALASLRSGEPVKASMWLGLAPDAPSTRFNRQLIGEALKTVQWPSSPEGEYWSHAGYGLWSSVVVRKEGGSFRITFNGFWMPRLGWKTGPNSGHAEEVVAIRNRVAVFHQEEEPACAITAHFARDKVVLSQSDACGDAFGANVQASGPFVIVSSMAPN